LRARVVEDERKLALTAALEAEHCELTARDGIEDRVTGLHLEAITNLLGSVFRIALPLTAPTDVKQHVHTIQVSGGRT
jgi:hypothetical protein